MRSGLLILDGTLFSLHCAGCDLLFAACTQGVEQLFPDNFESTASHPMHSGSSGVLRLNFATVVDCRQQYRRPSRTFMCRFFVCGRQNGHVGSAAHLCAANDRRSRRACQQLHAGPPSASCTADPVVAFCVRADLCARGTLVSYCVDLYYDWCRLSAWQTLDVLADLCKMRGWAYVRLDGTTSVKKRQKVCAHSVVDCFDLGEVVYFCPASCPELLLSVQALCPLVATLCAARRPVD